MIIYSLKMVLLLHLSMAASDTLSLKRNAKSSRPVLDKKRSDYSDYDQNSKVIQILPPPQAECYCGKKYQNSISDELNPTNKAEIERFVIYLYVKIENNKRVTYIYLPNTEKQKLMPDFAKSEGDVLVENPNTNDEVVENLADLNDIRGSDSDYISDNTNEEREYSSNLLHSIGSGILLHPQKTTYLLYPNRLLEKRASKNTWDSLDPDQQETDTPKTTRFFNERNLLQSIHLLLDEINQGVEDKRTGGIRSKLPWLNVNRNSNLYQEKETNQIKPDLHTIGTNTDDKYFQKDVNHKYVRPNLYEQQGFSLFNPVNSLSENSWKNEMEDHTRKRFYEQLRPLVLSPSDNSATKQWSWHKEEQAPPRSLNHNRDLKPLTAIQSSMDSKPWLHSVESIAAFGLVSTNNAWKKTKVTEKKQNKPLNFANDEESLELVSWSPTKKGFNLSPANNYQLTTKPLTPSQPKILRLQAPKPPIEAEIGYENNMNWLRPKDAIVLKPIYQSYANNDEELLSLVSLDKEEQNKNNKSWSQSHENELNGLDNPNMYETLYRQKHNDWSRSTEKPSISLSKEYPNPLRRHGNLEKPKSNRERWNLRVVSKSKNNFRPIHQGLQPGPKISPMYTPLYDNILKTSGPNINSARSIRNPQPRKSKPYRPKLVTNSTTVLPIEEDAPKFRIIGGQAAMGSGDPLKTKGRRSAGFIPVQGA